MNLVHDEKGKMKVPNPGFKALFKFREDPYFIKLPIIPECDDEEEDRNGSKVMLQSLKIGGKFYTGNY